MKVNIQRRVLPALLTLIIAVIAVFGIAVSASAAVIDPSDFGDYVVSGDTIIYNITDHFELFYWRRLHDGALGGTGTGKHFVYTTQMRYVDNDEVYLYPFGYNSSIGGAEFVNLNSYPLGSAISFKADFELTIPQSTQSYGTSLRIYWQFFDENKNSLGFNSKAFPIETGQSLRIYQIDETFSTTNPNARYFSCWLMWDFSGVANESDTTSVDVDTNAYTLSISFPVDRLGQLIDQGKLTNQQLDKIDQALNDNGMKLDDVNDHLNDIYNGTQEGQDAADDFADKAEQQGQQMGQMTDKLDSVEKPDISNVDLTIEGLMDRFASDEFNFIIRLLWNNDLIYQILLMSAVLMLVSYILFGKKV